METFAEYILSEKDYIKNIERKRHRKKRTK